MAYTRAYLERLDKEALVDLFLNQKDSQEQKSYNKNELLKLYADQIINLSPDAILLINHETLFLEGCNQAALSLLELETKENLASYLDALFQERPVFFEILKELGSALKDHPEVSMEVEITTSRSNQRWGHMVCKKISLLDNALLFIRIIDITNIKLTQQQLLESESRLAEAQQIAQLGSYTISVDSEKFVSHYSETFCEMMGISSQQEKDTFSTNYLQYIHPDDRMLVKSKLREILERKRGDSFEHRAITRQGEEKHILSIVRLEMDDEGLIQKLIGTIQDISDRKKAEARLMESEERYRITAENTNDGIWYWSKTSNETYISPKYRWMLDKLGIEHENFTLVEWDKLIHPDDYLPISRLFLACLEGRQPRFSKEIRLFSNEEGYQWFEAKGTVVVGSDGEIDAVLGAISSIHSRKLAEEKLLQQDKILNFAQHIAKVGSWTWHIESNHLEFSDELYNIYELDENLKGKTLLESLIVLVWEEDRLKVKNFIRNMISRSDESKTFSLEFRVRLTSGEEKVLRSSGKYYSSSIKGESVRIIGTTQDITEVKQREKELIQAKEQAEISKQAKDRFLQIVSHEIRNPLNAIVGISRLLQQPDQPNYQEQVKTLNFSASHLLSLINDILDTAKLQYGKITLEEIPFSISEQLRQTEDLFRPQLSDKETTLEVKVEDDIPEEVLGDPTRFNQIIFNLISNAVKYTYRGCISLKVSLLKQMSDHFLIQFVVSDSGVGILTKNLEKIFEAFEQDDLLINQQKGGTGLGLYIVKELVSLMSGSIRVESEFGKGTSFIFSLPFARVNQQELKEKSHELRKHFELTDLKVLYVEDAIYNQLLLKGYVKMWNLNLELAASLEDAEEMARSEKYDLVLTDFRLPDGSGEDVVEKLKKINSHYYSIPYIVISAYNLEDEALRHFDDYIQKPINFDKFFYVLRKYLSPKAEDIPQLEPSISGNSTFRNQDALAFLREYQPSHYQRIVNNMEGELLEIKGELSQSIFQQNYRLFLQTVHKLSSALKIMHENDFLNFLENISDLPTESSDKQELDKKLDDYFNEIIQRWEFKNLPQK